MSTNSIHGTDETHDTDETILSWAYLSRVAEPPCEQLAELVRQYGPQEAADRVRRGALVAELLSRTAARRHLDCAQRDLDQLHHLGGRLITPDHQEWPWLAFAAFTGLSAKDRPQGRPPLALWAIGPLTLDHIVQRAAAIVGTRSATTYGEHVSADISATLAEHEVCIVSGGAYGIDGYAHRAVLGVAGDTVAVLAGGIDIAYPAGHSDLLRRISASGLLISEYAPGTRPARHRFLTRNRLVAALSSATVVIEAGIRSGAANTASWARALGRVVCAVPGPVTSPASIGCHVLLNHGAHLVTRAEDILEIVGNLGELADEQPRPTTLFDTLSENERRVYDGLPVRGALTLDDIAIASGLAPTTVLGALTTLEIAGLVAHHEGRWQINHVQK